MKNVRLHMADDLVLDVARVRGVMTGRPEGKTPVFDDVRSYVIRVDVGEARMDMASLSNLMNHHVFAYEKAPLSDLTIATTPEGQLEMKGKLHKGLTVPFSSKTSVSVTEDGRLRLHVESMKAVGIPTKGLLGLLGLELDDLVNLKRRDVTVEENDIYVAPGQALPPPEIQGKLAKAAVVKDALILTFGPAGGRAPAALALPAPTAKNYLYFGSGSITFGKLTMRDADLQLIDADERDPFDFYPAKYEGQLIAGYSKNTPTHGLKTMMPDYDDLGRKAFRDLRPRGYN
jgi:hypothetical protein